MEIRMNPKKYYFSFRNIQKLFLALVLISIISACMVGPDYTRPDAPSSENYKETNGNQQGGGWKIAEPNEIGMQTNWWLIYHDQDLNQLMEQVNINNQNIIAAEAQYRQATALLTQARASLFPSLTANGSVNRGTLAGGNNNGFNTIAQTSNANLGASWMPDIWGQVRRNIEAGSATAQATAAQLDALRLSTQAALAQTYFQLRIADMQIKMYETTIQNYERSLHITENQYKAGIVTQLDVAQAQTLLESTRALAIDVSLSRAQLEHAIAILIGQTPSSFSLKPQELSIDPSTGLVVSSVSKLVAELPEVPIGIPSTLLERRPDIAAAERQMAAANAKIGVATAAFFPSLTISASTGYQGIDLPGLISAPLRYWSVGPALAQPLFDGGLRIGAYQQAQAVYDQEVAQYRQSVLSAFQNVEDNLVALRLLQNESKAQAKAVNASQNAVRISFNQYKSGVITYLDVATSQATELSNERTLMSLLNRQIAAHVGLITALGGGWNIKQISDK
jgi:NodT family efflux transporter outer membrane factor (OMF) lipoprotein